MFISSSDVSIGDLLSAAGLVLALIALLTGVIFAVSWLFQRLGEERLRNLVSLRDEVDSSVQSLQGAIAVLENSQRIALSTMERLVRSLDIIAAYIEVNGGVVQDILVLNEEAGNPKYAEVHQSVVAALRQANDELHILSRDPERRLSAVKNLGYGQGSFRALESVQTAILLYPGDTTLREVAEQLRGHLRKQTNQPD
jgi:hypothetical protein